MWWIFGGKCSANFPREKQGLKLVTENFTKFFTARKEIRHLELTLGASSPKTFPRKKGFTKPRDLGGISKTEQRHNLVKFPGVGGAGARDRTPSLLPGIWKFKDLQSAQTCIISVCVFAARCGWE